MAITPANDSPGGRSLRSRGSQPSVTQSKRASPRPSYRSFNLGRKRALNRKRPFGRLHRSRVEWRPPAYDVRVVHTSATCFLTAKNSTSVRHLAAGCEPMFSFHHKLPPDSARQPSVHRAHNGTISSELGARGPEIHCVSSPSPRAARRTPVYGTKYGDNVAVLARRDL